MTAGDAVQPPSHPRAPRRFVALDSLRGFAACMVVFHHIEGPGLFLESALVQEGVYFVDFFFVLSGFVIAANYGDRLREGFPLGRYMLRRLGRVWPLHLAVLAVLVAAKLASFALAPDSYPNGEAFYGDRSVENLLYATFLLHGWQEHNGWHTVSWSISIEVFLYLFFALVWRFLGRWGLAVAMLGIAYGCAASWGLMPGNAGIVRGLLGFSAGVLGWHVYRRYFSEIAMSPARATAWEMLTTVAMLAAVANLPLVSLPVGVASFMAVVLVYARDRGAISRLLARPLPVLLGTLSYSIYMIHSPVLAGARAGLLRIESLAGGGIVEGFTGPVAADLLALALLAAICALSTLSYRFIEAPAREWSRRVAKRMERGPAAHAAGP